MITQETILFHLMNGLKMQGYRHAENFDVAERTTFENALTSGPHTLSYSVSSSTTI